LKKIIVALAGCAVSVALIASSATGASSRATLAGSVPSWAKSANFKSSANKSDSVNFRVYLNLRNQAQAEQLARNITNPASASYGKYLTPGQFQSQFAPTQASVADVKAWLQSQGLTIDYVPGNNHYVAAEGSVAQAEAAFGTTLNMYSVAGKVLRAPSSALTVPASLANAVAGVIGVDQSAALVQTFAREPAAPPSAGFRNARPCSSYWDEFDTSNTPVSDPARGIGPTLLPNYAGSSRPFAPCGYYGKQLQNAYGVGSYIDRGQDGTGVTVAVIDAYASPTIEKDVASYFTDKGVPAFKPGQFTQSVAPGIYRRPENGRQDPQGWYGEETLDVEAVHTMAPGANVVYVGAPNNYQDLDAALNHVVERRLADIVTNSYGWNSEFLPFGFIKPYNDTMLQGVLEGIGIYFSSGDNGDETFGGPASTATPDWPATSPWVTAVGGTTLADGTAADKTQYLWETGWGTMRNRLNCSGLLQIAGNAWCGTEVYLYGSGGGTSRLFTEPWYQTNSGVVPTSLATRWSSTPHRVIPDISAVGDPNTGMLIGQTQQFSDGTYYDQFRIGGTSLSSPLMAGIMAVAQQVRGQRIGFANPLIYALPSGAFHDVLHREGAVIRADYANSENGADGILYSARTFDQTFSIHTTPGYDDVTGRGTPNDNGSYVANLATAKPVR
jgi:subtilase family serine protease